MEMSKPYLFEDFLVENQIKLKPAEKENLHEERLDLILTWATDGLRSVLTLNTLDYNYYIRIFLTCIKNKLIKKTRDAETIKDENIYLEIYNDYLLNYLIKRSFDYYNKHKSFFSSDISLNAISSICTNPILQQDPSLEDQYLTKLSQFFNFISKTQRNLYKCYDCGTNARSIFLNLIKANRGKLIIYPFERERIVNMYNTYDDDPIPKIKACKDFLINTHKNFVVIISLGLTESGHVYTLEKRIINGKENIQQYQSALNSHMILDFLEHVDIVSKIKNNISLNYVQMMDDLLLLFNLYEWKKEHKKIFTQWFYYIFGHEIKSTTDKLPDYSFSWTYVIYDDIIN